MAAMPSQVSPSAAADKGLVDKAESKAKPVKTITARIKPSLMLRRGGEDSILLTWAASAGSWMSSSIASAAMPRKPPARARAVAIMAGVGVLTGLISSIPSPLPDLRLEEPQLLINAEGIPLHAGIAFGAGVAIMLWLWVNRDLAKCLLAMALALMGWLAAVNTANDVMTAIVGANTAAADAIGARLEDAIARNLWVPRRNAVRIELERLRAAATSQRQFA